MDGDGDTVISGSDESGRETCCSFGVSDRKKEKKIENGTDRR